MHLVKSGTWDARDTTFLIIEFTAVVTIPENELYSAMHLPVKVQAVMQNNGHVGNLQVFSEGNRIAIFENTPAIGMHGPIAGLPLTIPSAQLFELVSTAEHRFKIAMARVEL